MKEGIYMRDIVLTDKQQECVKFDHNHDLLVRGIAGAGKSVVLVNRALKLAQRAEEKGKKPRIALLTYANSLVSYMQEILEACGSNYDNIEVSTLDKIANHLATKTMGLFKKVDFAFPKSFSKSTALKMAIGKLQEKQKREHIEMDNRFFHEENYPFLQDELEWMRQHNMKTEEDYLHCSRVGRGFVRPSETERKLIYAIYNNYYKLLSDKGIHDVDTVYNTVYEHKEEIPESEKYDFMLIDECQDLSLNKLLIARALTKISITLAADFAQKIYKTGFTWKELGINIRGQASKKLTGTHRNTYEILKLAQELVKHNTELQNMADEYIEPEMPTKHGNRPRLYKEPSLYTQNGKMIEIVKMFLHKYPTHTVGIILYSHKDIEKVQNILQKYGIKVEIITQNESYSVLKPGVKLVTYHSSKGLEFDDVLLPSLQNNKLGCRREDKLNEEDKTDQRNRARNLLYVGMTRARENLFLLYFTDDKYGKPNPILKDLDENLLEIHDDCSN